jgi:diadenylate cyclase
MVDHGNQPLTDALVLVAPGTPLREGLNRVLQAKRGALVVVGDGPAVLSLCTGGFLLDAEFSPQRLSELAKMDGAIILARDASRIARANVHLMPRATIPTSETGTRHRTAERLARSVDVPVITVSESMSTITVYRNDHKHTITSTAWLLDRARQALATLQRFKLGLDVALTTLSSLEVGDSVSARDVLAVVQPAEMVLRIADELEGYLVELGDDGRLIRLQLHELLAATPQILTLVLRDYVAVRGRSSQEPLRATSVVERAMRAENELRRLSPDDLLDPLIVAHALGIGTGVRGMDEGLAARGHRLLSQLPRLSPALIARIVERFGTVPRLMQASLADLGSVEGMGETRARALKAGLVRLVEASVLDRFG